MKISQLKPFLDSLEKKYVTVESISPDPLQFVHEYDDPRDREIVAVIASSLAYGNVRQIIKSIGNILAEMGKHPYRFVRGFDPDKHSSRFDGFKHRFNTGTDVSCLIYLLKGMTVQDRSVEDFFINGNLIKYGHVAEALESYCSRALNELDPGPFYGNGGIPDNAGVRFFFPLPSKGSACKRLNLMLRWMVRSEGVDLGVWKSIETADLIIPLDTHVARISRYLGLTDRKDAGMKTALDVTKNLRRLDPDDPVRYDFALARLGILDKCTRRYQPELCTECDLQPVCERPL